MESADASMLQSAIGNAEFKISELRREVDALNNLLRGAERQLVQTPSGITGFNKQWAVPAVTLGDVPADEAGGVFNHPFKLTVASSDGVFTWRVIYEGSTITDGTNGDSIDLTLAGFDADNTFAADFFIVLEADVDESLVITNWTLANVSSGSTDEVEFSEDDPPTQNKIRLLIGKVAVADESPVAHQACYTAQRIVHGVLNGVEVKVLESAPVHPEYL